MQARMQDGELPIPRTERVYLVFVTAILFFSVSMKIAVIVTLGDEFAVSDPLLPMYSSRWVLGLFGFMECTVLLFLVFGRRGMLKAIAVLWITSAWALYEMGISLANIGKECMRVEKEQYVLRQSGIIGMGYLGSLLLCACGVSLAFMIRNRGLKGGNSEPETIAAARLRDAAQPSHISDGKFS